MWYFKACTFKEKLGLRNLEYNYTFRISLLPWVHKDNEKLLFNLEHTLIVIEIILPFQCSYWKNNNNDHNEGMSPY
jgi:hypothetical protein